MQENDVYSELAKKLNAPVSKRFLSLVEELLTPEEVEICMELFTPATCPELASRFKVDEKSLAEKLGNLVDRGVLTRGETQYGFHTNLIGFCHDILQSGGVHAGPYAVTQKAKDLFADFFWNEWQDMMAEGASRMAKPGGPHINRVWPAIGALELSPNIRPEEILPEEDFREVVKNAKRRIICSCGCRVVWGKCDHPLNTCFSCFDNSRGEYYIDQPGRTQKEYSLEETLAIVYRNEELGLVHLGSCFCCPDHCMVLNPFRKINRMDLLPPSRFVAAVDEELCIGCQDCIERCAFDAIEMQKSATSKKLKAYIINENCKGCGVCIVGCKQKALRYEIARPPEYITSQPPPPADVGSNWGFYNLK